MNITENLLIVQLVLKTLGSTIKFEMEKSLIALSAIRQLPLLEKINHFIAIGVVTLLNTGMFVRKCAKVVM